MCDSGDPSIPRLALKRKLPEDSVDTTEIEIKRESLLEELDKYKYTLGYIYERTDSIENSIKFAQELGLLPVSVPCPSCSCELTKVKNSVGKGCANYYFECCRKRCKRDGKRRVCLKKGTWFSRAHISIRKSISLAFCFVARFDTRETSEVTSYDGVETSGETIADYFRHCREVCTEAILITENWKRIGGPNCIVEINATKLGKRKFKRGKLTEGQWVLGGICWETKDCFLVPTEDSSEEALLEIIKENVQEGSIIINNDCFRFYSNLYKLGYQLLAVNHGINFIDSESGECSNTIENTWWALRRSLPKKSALKINTAQHLCEYMYRKKYSNLCTSELFLQFIQDIIKFYPGPGVKN